tara:strand:+ start:475 stop:657 length:183 start_codon:yes stop_codon:yes gene_type:complete
MEDLIDLIATDAAAAEVSDKIKDILYTKSAERLEVAKPLVAHQMFDDPSEGETVEQEPEE